MASAASKSQRRPRVGVVREPRGIWWDRRSSLGGLFVLVRVSSGADLSSAEKRPCELLEELGFASHVFRNLASPLLVDGHDIDRRATGITIKRLLERLDQEIRGKLAFVGRLQLLSLEKDVEEPVKPSTR
jgi:hypothetical protein